jgi:hypothetical protein
MHAIRKVVVTGPSAGSDNCPFSTPRLEVGESRWKFQDARAGFELLVDEDGAGLETEMPSGTAEVL